MVFIIMSINTITLKIDNNKIPAKEFKESIEAFIDLIDSVAVNLCTGKCIEQFVSVEKGSAILISDIMPINEEYFEYPEKVVKAVSEGFECLEKESGKMPTYFNNKTLNLAKKIAKYNNIKIITSQKPEISLTNSTVVSINSILREKFCDIGSIEGIIQTITTRKGFKVTIYEALNDNPVKCIPPDDEKIQGILKNSIDKRVSAYGEIFYNKDGIPQRINVKELRLLSDEGLPNWEDVRGILNDQK